MRSGAVVIACTHAGFWLRARVAALDDSEARVRFGDPSTADRAAAWLPRLEGIATPEESLTPERVAALPDGARARMPAAGGAVVVLWDRKRFHPAILVRRTSERTGIVRYDEGDEDEARAEDILVRGTLEDGALARAAALGLTEGASVLVDRGPGWVSAVGSRTVYVRFPGASHGVWYPLDAVRPGGDERPPKPKTGDRGALAVGARVVARWVDRVWYPGTVRSVRRERAEAEIAWDDGTAGAVPASRIVVTAPAPKSVPKTAAPRVRGPEGWARECKIAVLARVEREWERGIATAARGGDAFVTVTRSGERLWARGKSLAVPVDASLLPEPGTEVIVEDSTGRGKKKPRYRPGRAVAIEADSIQVRLEKGGVALAKASSVFVRLAEPPPTPVPAGVTVGASVMLELRPGEELTATVRAIEAQKGIAQVELDERKPRAVDLARVRALAEPDAPAPVAASPPRPAEGDAPDSGERAADLLRRVAERWNGERIGYREAAGGSSTRCELDVASGELCLEVRSESRGLVVTVTASGKVERAPPVDGASVRLARWLRTRLAGELDAPRAIDDEDRAWAEGVVTPEPPLGVARAGGAISLSVRTERTPEPSEVIRWARAVHARLFDGELSRPGT